MSIAFDKVLSARKVSANYINVLFYFEINIVYDSDVFAGCSVVFSEGFDDKS